MKRILTITIALTFMLTTVLLIASCSSPTPQVGKQAPDFQLPSLGGQSVSLSDFQGKPILLNFWATWCGPCRHEMPFIQAIYEEQSVNGLVILAIDIGESVPAVNSFLQSNNFSFPVLLDIDQDVAQDYNIRAIPTTFFIDKDGIIQEIKVGAFSNMIELKKSLSKITS
jgi:peroxiredoxin